MSIQNNLTIEDADCIFENKSITVFATRNEEEIKLPGFKVGPFEEGREYNLLFWVAKELEKAGVIRFREEDILDIVKLHKIHWKERVQPTNRVAPLDGDFYPKLRYFLHDLLEVSKKKPQKLKEYEKSKKIVQDIVNCRTKKIVSLASSPPITAQTLNKFTPEEQSLYNRLYKTINEWRNKILSEGLNIDRD